MISVRRERRAPRPSAGRGPRAPERWRRRALLLSRVLEGEGRRAGGAAVRGGTWSEWGQNYRGKGNIRLNCLREIRTYSNFIYLFVCWTWDWVSYLLRYFAVVLTGNSYVCVFACSRTIFGKEFDVFCWHKLPIVAFLVH